MRTELPVCQRCCFCLPLRYGLLTWGYFRLALSLFFLTVISIAFCGMMEMVFTEGGFPSDTVYTLITGSLLLLAITDVVLNTLFIVGGHKKSLKMLRAYYIYSLILCVLTSLMGIASAIWTFFLFKIGEIELTFHIWIVLVDTATLLAQILAQVYALLLLRSEILKLRSQCEFRFVNNAAEAECTMECEEINRDGLEYTYERYISDT